MSSPNESPVTEFDNVVLLSVDSLRFDRIHATRNGNPLTPNINKLADEALDFQPGVTPGPSTRDSIPSILTGKYPSEFDKYGLPSPGTPPLTIAEELSNRGFATALLSHNNFTSRRYNINRGFDYVDDVSPEARKQNNRGVFRLYVRNLIEDTPLMRAALKTNELVMRYLGRSLLLRNEDGKQITQRAIDWMEKADQKRFLWLHYMDTHHPYLSPQRVQQQFGHVIPEKRIKQLSQKTRNAPEEITDEDASEMKYIYDCAVRYVDEQIGRVFEYLRDVGEFQNSLIVVTGDHGEGLGEFGKYGHADELWDSLITVPLIIRHPNYLGKTVNGQAPVRLLKDTIVDNKGLFELVDGGADHVYTEIPDYQDDIQAVRGQKFKLIQKNEKQIVTQVIDGDEKQISIGDLPRGEFKSHKSKLERSFDTTHVDSDIDRQKVEEDLAALGYLDE